VGVRSLNAELERRLGRKDASNVSVEVGAKRLPDGGMQILCNDLTERLRADDDLRESEENFRRLAEAANDVLVVHDMSGRVEYANPAAFAVFGATRDDLIGANIADFIAPKCRGDMLEREGRRRHSDGTHLRYETIVLDPDGNRRTIDVSSSLMEKHGRPVGVLVAGRDITEQKQLAAELEQGAARLRDYSAELERSLELVDGALSSMVAVVGRVVEIRDPYTAGHERRVSELAVCIAQELGMSAEDVKEIRVAALIHDVGKIAVPAEILTKSGGLSPSEFALIEGHAQAGYEILELANVGGSIAEMVRQHHERCDGSGYPRGLHIEDLLPGARVLMVADVVEAMTSHRPYRPAFGIDTVLVEIESGAGARFDVDVCRACAAVFREQGFDFSYGDTVVK
jgi:PAS domain S-box-containing protein/putative nucleotidyltransferase with HDIG domain